ncbi:MAG: M23 family metallopeptidase [Thermomicrobiales bacterium]|nr:M23 family metallopeptidase [Thermomicrobiales bacterium]
MTARRERASRGQLSRRALAGFALAAIAPRHVRGQHADPLRYQLPMGVEGALPGDRCYIRHGYACENTGFNTGWWHTGENWYTDEGNSAGALVYAVADGEVVYADADYPGRVVIIRHLDGLYSMYGHLDHTLLVNAGDVIERGATIGTVLFRTDTRSPSHLHFEIRRFLLEPVVNGNAPRYEFACGFNCPPGPGYWPMGDAQHPSELGWLNPTHVIGRFGYSSAWGVERVVVTSMPASSAVAVRSTPDAAGEELGTIDLIPGDRLLLLDSDAGEPESVETSANAYQLLVRIETPGGVKGWIPAIEASAETTGADGRPSAVRFNVVPDMG